MYNSNTILPFNKQVFNHLLHTFWW